MGSYSNYYPIDGNPIGFEELKNKRLLVLDTDYEELKDCRIVQFDLVSDEKGYPSIFTTSEANEETNEEANEETNEETKKNAAYKVAGKFFGKLFTKYGNEPNIRKTLELLSQKGTRSKNSSTKMVLYQGQEKKPATSEIKYKPQKIDGEMYYFIKKETTGVGDLPIIMGEDGKAWKDKEGTPWAVVPNIGNQNLMENVVFLCAAIIPKDDQRKYLIRVDFKEKGAEKMTPSDDIEKAKKLFEEHKSKSKIGDYIEHNRQVIFTGAPGTGKTFGIRQHIKLASHAKGKLMLDGVEIKQSEFVQFHSSYDYSDFVEGLRPVQVEDRQTHKKEVMFVRMDGIFKRFCRNIVEYNLQVLNSSRDVNHRKFLMDRSIEALMEACDLGEDATEAQQEKKKAIVAKINETKFYFVIDEINRADLGKVFGELMFGLEEAYRGVENRFATQYANLPTYYVDPAHPEKNGFYQMIQAKGKNKTKQTKQTEQAEQVEQTAQTNQDCISKEDVFARGFFIPENLYIVGSMNDIDRSVESFDFALRRRFKWIDIKANDCMNEVLTSMNEKREQKLSEKEVSEKELSEKELSKTKLGKEELRILVDRATALNDVIWCKQGDAKKTGDKDVNLGAQFGLNEAFHIGPAYFKDYNPTDVDETWTSRIEPILREYVRGRDAKKVENFIETCRKAYTEVDEKKADRTKDNPGANASMGQSKVTGMKGREDLDINTVVQSGDEDKLADSGSVDKDGDNA